MHVHMNMSANTHTHMHTQAQTHICTYMYAHIHVNVHVHIQAQTHICTHMYAHIQVSAHMHTHTHSQEEALDSCAHSYSHISFISRWPRVAFCTAQNSAVAHCTPPLQEWTNPWPFLDYNKGRQTTTQSPNSARCLLE